MQAGIYRICNKINNKSYVGQTVNLAKRWSIHMRDYKHSWSNHPILHKAFDKYGVSNFIYVPVRRCDINDLNKYIPPSKEQFISSGNYVVCQYDLDGNLIDVFKNRSIAINKYGGSISQCLAGKYKKAYGYMW